jgi:hypothetical protein
MKTLLLSTFAFGALTTVALAAPAMLTDENMDTVVAGNCGVPDGQSCFVGGYNNGNGAAYVEHLGGDHAETCTPAGCTFREHRGTGDAHVYVTPKNNP